MIVEKKILTQKVMQPRMNLANQVHAILKGPLGDDVLIEIKFGGIYHSDIH